MTFTYNRVESEWESDCGNYFMWIQSRPIDDSPHWAARYGKINGGNWIDENHTNRSDAMNACRTDAERLLKL